MAQAPAIGEGRRYQRAGRQYLSSSLLSSASIAPPAWKGRSSPEEEKAARYGDGTVKLAVPLVPLVVPEAVIVAVPG
jgi:hypothetical protein